MSVTGCLLVWTVEARNALKEWHGVAGCRKEEKD